MLSRRCRPPMGFFLPTATSTHTVLETACTLTGWDNTQFTASCLILQRYSSCLGLDFLTQQIQPSPVRYNHHTPLYISTTYTTHTSKHGLSHRDHLPPYGPLSTETNDDALFNLDLLHLKPEHRVWFGVVNLAVRNFMNGLDPSHTYQYTRRLVSNAIRILDKEKKHHEWARRIDPVIIWVACMTSAVGASEHETDNWDYDQIDIIDDFLKPLGCPLHIRRQAAHLAARVSATAKSSNQDDMDAFAREYPPFRVIHDARRLDELGAIGMSRLILNHDMSESPRWAVIQSNVRLLEDRFAHYSRLMLTDSGRKMAEQRYKWMVEGFLGQWKRETDTSNV